MKWIIGIIPALIVVAWGRGEGSASRPSVTRTEEWTLAREGAGGLELRTQSGNVQVVGAAVDQLQVRAFKEARGDSDADARSFLEMMRVERRRDGDRWVVEASWPEPRPRGIEHANVNFEIQVPQGMRLEAESRGGNMEVSGVGQPRLHTGGGNIQVQACSGPFELDTGGGNIDLHQAQEAVKAHTGGGNIQVEGHAGPVDAHTGGGNIEIRQAESPVKAITGAGNVEVEMPRASGGTQVELGTGAGNVELRLSGGVSARLEANTNLGNVQLEPDASGHYNRGHNHLQAVLGDGQGSVRLRTGVGNIAIRLTSQMNAQTPKPDRILRDHAIVSEHDPRVTITIPKQALYVGADRWILYDVADCELHVLVEADANKVVQRLYWIQFESYVPSRPELKHNYTDPVQQIQGIDFHVLVSFGGMDEWGGPGSDVDHVRKMLQSAGFIAPKGIMFVRFVHLPDPQMRKELMVIYAENLDSMRIAWKDLKPGGKSADRWPELEKELVRRASERIRFSQFSDQ